MNCGILQVFTFVLFLFSFELTFVTKKKKTKQKGSCVYPFILTWTLREKMSTTALKENNKESSRDLLCKIVTIANNTLLLKIC